MVSQLTIVAGGAAIAWWLRNFWTGSKTNPHRLPHPPGPKGYPIIGAMFDLPLQTPWLTYDKWFKKYGVPDPFS
jgi:hypothetical protein